MTTSVEIGGIHVDVHRTDYNPRMTELFSLGDLYVSDFLRPDEQPRAEPMELKLIMDEDTSIVHLERQPDHSLMWGRYWYRSGTNATMTRELGEIVESIKRVTELEAGDIWVDIASNDGTLLKQIPNEVVGVGIDPADDTFRIAAEKYADLVIQEPFSIDAWNRSKYAGETAKVVTCIAMFYDLEDPTDFLAGVRQLLDRDGVFVLQLSYTPLMLQQLAFDNICHEHVRYYTLYTLRDTLENAGFRVMDVQLNDVNGGSFRVYVMRDDADITRFATAPARDVAAMRWHALTDFEMREGVNEPSAWRVFWNDVQRLKEQTVEFIKRCVDNGEVVWGYGASTKGNTLLQFFGLDYTLVSGIAERSPYKFGLRTVGTDIPIYSEEVMREVSPDYMLMLPWHFVSEFTRREAAYLEGGGKFIVPCPKFKIISR